MLGDYVNAINSEFGDKIQLAADFSRALCRWCTDVDIEGLTVAISVFARAAEAASSNDPSRAFYAYCQGRSLHALFDRQKTQNSRSILDDAIEALDSAMNSSNPQSLSRPLYVRRLGCALEARGEHTREIRDVGRGIELKQVALELMPRNHPE